MTRIEEKLRTHGLRATPQRVAIARRVLKAHDHFTADQIVMWAKRAKLRLSRATVYNTLNEFVATGLLKTFYSATMEQMIFDSNVSEHVHFLDIDTNRLFDVDVGALNFKIAALKDYEIESTEILFRGRKRATT